MLKSTRHDQIKQFVATNGQASVTELNALLDVSEATIRRDLDEMEKLGWLRRTHGGAIPAQRANREPPILQRAGENSAEKIRIGRLAAGLITAGQTIFLGSGSTVHQIATNLDGIHNLTVITNALNIVNELNRNPEIELIVIGGMLRQSEQSMVGHIAEAAIREFRADQLFMGMRGIDPQHGFTNDFMLEAATDRAILSIAPQVVIVADHSKIGRVSTIFLAPITAAQMIITDKGADPDVISAVREQGLEVRLA